jgi:gamma-glutamyltranspeptidase/glutathione hydrolase
MRTARALLCLTVLASAALEPLAAQSGRTPTPARHTMVSSSHYLASQVADQTLRDGGNAVDAAVAMAFALAVTLPSAGNIGGGGFLLFHGADGTTTSFDFRERAPLAATATMFLDENGEIRDNSNHAGLLSVGVPGTVAGLWLAHQRLGSLPWEELVEPAVELAEEGIPSTWAMQPFLHTLAADPEKLPSTARAFLKPGNVPYEPGEIWRQGDLARTLGRIAKQGRDGFYKGETARLLADFMRRNGGLITAEDLAGYQAVERQPIHGTYRGFDVYSMPPPSSGGVAIVEMLNVLEGFDLEAMGHNSAVYLHVLAETMRRAFADRAEHLGDPEANPQMPIERLISKSHAQALRQTIDLFRTSPSDLETFSRLGRSIAMAPESEETTHFSVVDRAGNAVSLTYTIEAYFGSKIVAEGAGFLLNNEMGDFNPIPGRTAESGLIGTPPNLVAPGKRMLSSMSPTIVARDGRPVLVIGSPGGRTIINTTLQVILNVIDHGMDVAEAIEAGRIHHQWFPDVLWAEEGALSPDTLRLLEMRGHEIRFRESQGAANGIYLDAGSGLLYGGADSRSFDARAIGH